VLTPSAVVGATEIAGVSELDEHVERHHQTEDVLATVVVDDVLDRDQRASGWQGLVGPANELELPVQVLVMQDHAHRDDFGLRQRIGEEVTRCDADPVSQSRRVDVAPCNGLDNGEVEAGAL